MSQPVTATWYIVKSTGRDVHSKEDALEFVRQGLEVVMVSNGSPDPKGRRVHGRLKEDGTVESL